MHMTHLYTYGAHSKSIQFDLNGSGLDDQVDQFCTTLGHCTTVAPHRHVLFYTSGLAWLATITWECWERCHSGIHITHTYMMYIYIYTFIYFHIYNYIWLYLHMYIHVHEVIDVFGPFSTLALVFYGLARSTSRKTTMVCSLLLFMYVHVFQEANSGWQHLTSERHGRLFANISLRAGGQMLQTRVASLTPSNAGGCGSYRHHCGDVMSQSGNGRAASV